MRVIFIGSCAVTLTVTLSLFACFFEPTFPHKSLIYLVSAQGLEPWTY